MVLGKNCRKLRVKRRCVIEEEKLGFEFIRYTRLLLRQRIVVSSDREVSRIDLDERIGDRVAVDSEKSRLEELPEDILIRIMCGVNHDDLKQLFHVSKTIREAVLISRESHFAFSTPSKTPVFRASIDSEDLDDEIEAPNAPKQWRSSYRSQTVGKNLDHISVALFTSPDDDEIFQCT